VVANGTTIPMTNEPITITDFLAWRIVAAPNWMCLVTSLFLAD
jgi:hypothetical protein